MITEDVFRRAPDLLALAGRGSLTNATSSAKNAKRAGRDTKIQANAQLKLGKRGYKSIGIGQCKGGDNIEASVSQWS